jgi:branched-subunit amino acid transport protein
MNTAWWNEQTGLVQWLTIAALVGVTVLSRSLFFISRKPWALPHWAQRGLQYAPIAALAAVIAPEIVMSQGMPIHTWQDARLFAAFSGAAYFFGAEARVRPCWAPSWRAWRCTCPCTWFGAGKAPVSKPCAQGVGLIPFACCLI